MSNADATHNIDWETLAHIVGAIRDDGSEHASTLLARHAIERIIGEDTCRSAVDYYVSCGRGSELVRSILWHIHPWSAMERCYQIYNDDECVETRRAAIELLRVVADARVLPWVPGLLNDSDDGVQSGGAGIVDQLLFSHLVSPEDCSDIMSTMANHSNEQVRNTHDFIQSYLKSREETA